MLTLHAEGAQVYECKAAPTASPAWAFRETDCDAARRGKTIGRHYAGPNWEHADGSAVVGKAAGNAPGATTERYSLAEARSRFPARQRVLADVTTVQRINTQGGKLAAPATRPAPYRNVPYSADYVFLRKG